MRIIAKICEKPQESDKTLFFQLREFPFALIINALTCICLISNSSMTRIIQPLLECPLNIIFFFHEHRLICIFRFSAFSVYSG